jgi:hypothetical protein
MKQPVEVHGVIVTGGNHGGGKAVRERKSVDLKFELSCKVKKQTNHKIDK